MIITIDRTILQLIYLFFYRNVNLNDSSLTNFGKSLENIPTLNSISLDFSL